jgi:hypothetical protein
MDVVSDSRILLARFWGVLRMIRWAGHQHPVALSALSALIAGLHIAALGEMCSYIFATGPKPQRKRNVEFQCSHSLAEQDRQMEAV